jgi:hypothetical protein
MTRAEVIVLLSTAYPQEARDLVIEFVQEAESVHPAFIRGNQNTDACWADKTPDRVLCLYRVYRMGA